MKIYSVITLLICLAGGCSKPEPETYIIPFGYLGRVNIIFNQKNGMPVKYENGRRIYEIPSNGILLTQFKDEYGFINHQFYYSDILGNRQLLPIYKEERNSDGTTKWIIKNNDEVGIFLDGTTGQYDKPDKAPFQEFVVCRRNNIDSFFTTEYKKQFEKNLRTLTKLNIYIP